MTPRNSTSHFGAPCVLSFFLALVFGLIGLNAIAPQALAQEKATEEYQSWSLQEVRAEAAKIDALLEAARKAEGVAANPIIDDATFLRRAYLTIAGRVPTVTEAKEFLDADSSLKRPALIEYLVESDGFESQLFLYFGDLLRLKSGLDHHGPAWHLWMRQAIANDKPYNVMVKEMLGASGHCTDNPAVGYYLRDRNNLLDNVANTVQVFLGQQIGCAQCHDHPTEDWTQRDFYELAAYSAGADYKPQALQMKIRSAVKTQLPEGPTRPTKPAEFKNRKEAKKFRASMGQFNRERRKHEKSIQKEVKKIAYIFRDHRKSGFHDNTNRQLKYPDDYKYKDVEPGSAAKPRTPFGDRLSGVTEETRLQSFADWVTNDNNPYFSKNISNRLWKRAFGYGLFEPVDNWLPESESSHPELMAHLEKTMRERNYQLREYLRLLYHTKLFQREVFGGELVTGTPYYFPGPLLRRMSGEELHDTFITLSHGNRDKTNLAAAESAWADYRKRFQSYLEMPVAEMVKLGGEYQESFKENRRLQAKLKAGRGLMRKAQASGDEKLVQTTRQELKEVRKAKKEIQSNKTFQKIQQINKAPNFKKALSKQSRAADKPAPLKPGKIAREFGASDRATPSSARVYSSVPQALSLLNGNEVIQFTTNRKSPLNSQELEKKSPADRLEHIWLAIYNAYPTAAERERFEPMMEDKKKTQTLVRAMLNSKRFLFVQ